MSDVRCPLMVWPWNPIYRFPRSGPAAVGNNLLTNIAAIARNPLDTFSRNFPIDGPATGKLV